ncbi:MAG: hypothetical protein ACI9UU_000323 [Candidatus Azotimanducaceae bacterium]|jgi:hypothetical protein
MCLPLALAQQAVANPINELLTLLVLPLLYKIVHSQAENKMKSSGA